MQKESDFSNDLTTGTSAYIASAKQEGRYFIQEDAPPVREIKVKNNPVVRLLSIIFDRPTKREFLS